MEDKDLYDQLGVEPKSEGGAGDILAAGGKSAAISAGISGLGKVMQLAPQAPIKAAGKFLSAAPIETAIGSAAGGMTGEFLKRKACHYQFKLVESWWQARCLRLADTLAEKPTSLFLVRHLKWLKN